MTANVYAAVNLAVHVYYMLPDHFPVTERDAVQRVECKCLYSMFTSHLLCICLGCG